MTINTKFNDPLNVLRQSLAESVKAGLMTQEQADKTLASALGSLKNK